MNVLVTGATGFVGSAIARRLLAGGDTVHVLAGDASRAASLAAAGARVFRSHRRPQIAAAPGCKLVVRRGDRLTRDAHALRWTNVAGTNVSTPRAT